ncbi:hypothetical protein [Streptomyces brevispora]|uniref:Uncharacterized protein n=1 Tax=Streptomyces brevispora TaxID=887462 RepID=A0ABZ1G5H7_9ACTN|nr:hypothetical protein [Streptomyces brevispora]WSC15092.1 hypothetical protein OIE64_21130 [Streptomyces brevispora]
MQDIIERYEDHESASALGAAYGVSTRTILRVLSRHDVPRRGNRLVLPLSNDEIALRYTEGREQIQVIAEDLGVSRHTVAKRLDEKGVRRTVGHRGLELSDAAMAARRSAGESARSIAADLGISHTTVLKRTRALLRGTTPTNVAPDPAGGCT